MGNFIRQNEVSGCDYGRTISFKFHMYRGFIHKIRARQNWSDENLHRGNLVGLVYS